MREADNITTILGHCHVIWEPYLPGTLWAPRACNGTALPLPYIAYLFVIHCHVFLSVNHY